MFGKTKKLNKWQYDFYFGRDYRIFERGWKIVRFGIFNIHTMPEEGYVLQKKHYKGFILKFYIWLPIDF